MSVKVKTPEKAPKPELEKTETPIEQPHETQHPLMTLRSDVDRLFDDFFKGFTFGPFGRPFDMAPFRRLEERFHAQEMMMPKADIVETDTAFVLTAELPGMGMDDIEVTITEEHLTLQGEKKEEEAQDHDNVHLMERRYGTIRRTFPVPETVLRDKVSADFKDGILTITMPKRKTTPPKTRKIKVKG